MKCGYLSLKKKYVCGDPYAGCDLELLKNTFATGLIN
jgi:hypothetical protein